MVAAAVTGMQRDLGSWRRSPGAHSTSSVIEAGARVGLCGDWQACPESLRVLNVPPDPLG